MLVRDNVSTIHLIGPSTSMLVLCATGGISFSFWHIPSHLGEYLTSFIITCTVSMEAFLVWHFFNLPPSAKLTARPYKCVHCFRLKLGYCLVNIIPKSTYCTCSIKHYLQHLLNDKLSLIRTSCMNVSDESSTESVWYSIIDVLCIILNVHYK